MSAHDPSEPHVLPLRTYFGVFATLLVLTGVTTGVAYVDLGALNTTVALLIAGVKATCVILIFMHVKFSGRLIWLFAGAGFAWLVILIAMTLSDYRTRQMLDGWGGWGG